MRSVAPRLRSRRHRLSRAPDARAARTWTGRVPIKAQPASSGLSEDMIGAKPPVMNSARALPAGNRLTDLQPSGLPFSRNAEPPAAVPDA
jgi:hypothetical protein